MKPLKQTGNNSASSRERGANYDLQRAMLDRDELVIAAVDYAIKNRRDFNPNAAAKVVADQAELETFAVGIDAEVVNLDTERERFTAEARRLVDEVQDQHEEAA